MPNIEPSIAGKRCLVLDDEFLIALDIQQILEAAGAANVTCFGDARPNVSLHCEAAKQFDLAMLDFKLATARAAAFLSPTLLHKHGTPFVFLTGMRSQDDAIDGISGGAGRGEALRSAVADRCHYARARHSLAQDGITGPAPRARPGDPQTAIDYAAVCHCFMASLRRLCSDGRERPRGRPSDKRNDMMLDRRTSDRSWSA